VSNIEACHSSIDIWKQVWHLAARGVSHSATSRASCYLLTKMLERDVLPYHEVGEELTTIVTSADVNGPATLSDSSVTLMSLIFHIRNTKVPNASRSTCSHIIRWLFFRWNPGKIDIKVSRNFTDYSSRALFRSISIESRSAG
jgi:serine-protein kinase ATM